MLITNGFFQFRNDIVKNVGKLPTRYGSVVAGVLVYLIENTKPLTVWDGVDMFRTVNLASAINSLRSDYGWPIEHVEFPTFKTNGHAVWTAGYVLPAIALDFASKDPKYQIWVEKVRTAQAAKRQINYEKAAAIDAYRFDTDPSAVDKTNSFLAAYMKS